MTLPVLQWDMPEVGAKMSTEVSLLIAPFGDGYTQVSPDGLNWQRKVWDVSWPYMTLDRANMLYGFFHDTCGGGASDFLWTAPRTTVQQRWSCQKFDWIEKEAGFVTITATIRRSFNLDG